MRPANDALTTARESAAMTIASVCTWLCPRATLDSQLDMLDTLHLHNTLVHTLRPSDGTVTPWPCPENSTKIDQKEQKFTEDTARRDRPES
jgi:hypothetical protein